MAGVWTVTFVYGLFFCFASSQQIYINENNDCVRNEQTLLALKDQINSIRQENARITMNQKKITEDFDHMFKILKKNITDLHEDLKSSILQIIKYELNINKDCKDLYINGITKSGVYEINPFGIKSKMNVYCEMLTEGGGWTAIQKRVSGSVRFNRTWAEYKTGFGDPKDSYWIGNDVIHQITKGRNSYLYVSITLTNGTKLYELYHQFSVADETNNYTLFLGGPATGTLGDRMLDTWSSGGNLSGMSFSTLDRDHDGSCAVVYGGGGGWWYNACHDANLNGQWSDWYEPWYPPLKNGSDITETVMMIKPN